MILESVPMPGTQRAKALEKSNVPTVTEVVENKRQMASIIAAVIVGVSIIGLLLILWYANFGN